MTITFQKQLFSVSLMMNRSWFLSLRWGLVRWWRTNFGGAHLISQSYLILKVQCQVISLHISNQGNERVTWWYPSPLPKLLGGQIVMPNNFPLWQLSRLWKDCLAVSISSSKSIWSSECHEQFLFILSFRAVGRLLAVPISSQIIWQVVHGISIKDRSLK